MGISLYACSKQGLSQPICDIVCCTQARGDLAFPDTDHCIQYLCVQLISTHLAVEVNVSHLAI